MLQATATDSIVLPKPGELWKTDEGNLIQIILYPVLLYSTQEQAVIYQDFLNCQEPIVCKLDDFFQHNFIKISDPFYYLQERIVKQSQKIAQLHQEVLHLRGVLLTNGLAL